MLVSQGFKVHEFYELNGEVREVVEELFVSYFWFTRCNFKPADSGHPERNPETLARYDRSMEKWNLTEDTDVPRVPAETASLLARLCSAADSESLRSALVDLDLSLAPCHLDSFCGC